MNETIKEIFTYLDAQLSINSSQSLKAVIAIATDNEIYNICRTDSNFIFLCLALNIYTREIIELPFEKTIFHNVYSINAIRRKLTLYKHLIFNIDFDVVRSNAIDTILEAMQNNTLSKVAIKYLIDTMSLNKETTANLLFNQEYS